MKHARIAVALVSCLFLVTLGTNAALGGASPFVVAGPAGVGLPAQVVPIDLGSSVKSFPMIDYGKTKSKKDDQAGVTQWRVVSKSGNCCENYLLATAMGRLMDMGGCYVNYTDDDGETWYSVRTIEPMFNGEGALVGGFAGDVFGATWDAYTGDRLYAFKYDAGSDAWLYQEMPVHSPVYDRPWIGFVPGPVNAPAGSAEYVTFVHGGTATKEPLFYSTDGLTYIPGSSPQLDAQASGATFEGPFDITASDDFDWMQTTGLPFTPLGNGKALAQVGPGGWAVFDGDAFEWQAYTLADGNLPAGLFQVDSAGRLHNVFPAAEGLVYRISTDGGENWNTLGLPIQLPGARAYDFKVNLEVGLGVVAIHAPTPEGTDQDLVLKFDIRKDTARLVRQYQVGLGDTNAGSGLSVTPSIRFDFDSVAILPDGRVAVSFLDSTTRANGLRDGELIGPELAIELKTKLGKKLPPPAEAPPPPAGVTVPPKVPCVDQVP